MRLFNTNTHATLDKKQISSPMHVSFSVTKKNSHKEIHNIPMQ